MAGKRLFACAVLLGCTSAHQAAAEGTGPLHDRFNLDLGTYFMSSDTTVRADSIEGIDLGTSLNLEDTFGIGDETVFRLEGAWRFNERHKLRVMYFDSNRTARASATEEIRFDGEVFPVGVAVDVEFDFEILELAYEYDFLRRETYELGASIGIHRVAFKTGLAAELIAPGPSLTETREADVVTDAPLPVIGLRGNWNFAGDWYLQGHAQYFQIDYDGFDGRLVDYQMGVLWQFSRYIGVGVSYNLFDTSTDIDDGRDFQGHLDWKYEGGQAYLRATF